MGQDGSLASQYLADQLTLFQLGRADYPQPLLLAPQTFSPSGITANWLDLKKDTLKNILKRSTLQVSFPERVSAVQGYSKLDWFLHTGILIESDF